MESIKEHPIWSKVIAGLILAAILGGLGLVSPPFLEFLKGVGSFLWTLMTSDLQIPVWLFALLTVPLSVILGLLILHWHRTRSAPATPSPSPQSSRGRALYELPDVERHFLQAFLIADKEELRLAELERELHQVPRLRLNLALETLDNLDLCNFDSTDGWGHRLCRLTSKGRQLLFS